MGQLVSKLFLKIVEACKYCSFHSKCCGDEGIEMEVVNERPIMDTKTDYDCMCIHYHKKSVIHSRHKNT